MNLVLENTLFYLQDPFIAFISNLKYYILIKLSEGILVEQNFEIEFKNLLTNDEYLELLDKEFPDDSNQRRKKAIYQTNYYYDTSNKDLKKQNSALRIRITDSMNEMTLKVTNKDFLMENNLN